MADTIKSSNELKLNSYYADSDTRTIILKNPKPNLTEAEIKTVEQSFITNQPLIGDKTGAAFEGFNSAKIIEKTTVNLAL